MSASKDIQLAELESLASNGFLAVGIDNVGHGDRQYTDFDARFSEDNQNRLQNIINAVNATADEIGLIIDYLVSNKIANESSIGIAGISMGAFIAYKIPTLDHRVKTISAILGSPEHSFTNMNNYVKQYDSISLLSQNAAKDNLVSPCKARNLHHKLKKSFKNYNERFKYIEYQNSGHFMEEADWIQCWDLNLEWFKKMLQ